MFYGEYAWYNAPLFALFLGIYTIFAIFVSLICALIIDIILSRRKRL
jgi:thiamine transporter ThiT